MLSYAPPNWLLITACVLSASISDVFKPIGRPAGYFADIKQNLFTFSPVLAVVFVARIMFIFVHWTIASLTDTYSAMYIIGRLYFDFKTPGYKRLLEPNDPRSMARRVFLLVVTLPCYITMLLTTDGYRWMKLFLTGMVMEAVLVEVFLSLMVYSPDKIWLRRNWPTQTFLGKGDVDHNGLPMPMHHSQTLGAALSRAQEPPPSDAIGAKQPAVNSQSSEPSSQHRGPNLCNLVEQFWSTPNSTAIAEGSDEVSRIFRVLNHTSRGWKCSHYRCLAFSILKIPILVLGKLHWTCELIATIWAVHKVIQPFTVQFAGFISPSGDHSTWRILFFFPVDYLGAILVSTTIHQVLTRIPSLQPILQWFRALSRVPRWIMYAIFIGVYLGLYFLFVRPRLEDKAVLIHLVEAVAFVLIVIAADIVASFIVWLFGIRSPEEVPKPDTEHPGASVSEGLEVSESDAKGDNSQPGESQGAGGSQQNHDQERRGAKAPRRRVTLPRLLLIRIIILVPAGFAWLFHG